MKKLIFLCGYDPFYFGLANMAARTIRDGGYAGDLVIFTTQDAYSPYGECINLATHPERELITPAGWKYFHKSLCQSFGYESYSSPLDYFIIKTLPGSIIDKSKYDFILYMDSDLLIHPEQNLEEIFSYQTPVSDFNSKNAFDDAKGLKRHFTEQESQRAAVLRGVGGGAFGIPKRYFDFFEVYRENYLRYLSEVPHDQPVLSFVKVRYEKDFPFVQWPNRKFFRHFWGYKKKEMFHHFINRYGISAIDGLFHDKLLESVLDPSQQKVN